MVNDFGADTAPAITLPAAQGRAMVSILSTPKRKAVRLEVVVADHVGVAEEEVPVPGVGRTVLGRRPEEGAVAEVEERPAVEAVARRQNRKAIGICTIARTPATRGAQFDPGTIGSHIRN